MNKVRLVLLGAVCLALLVLSPVPAGAQIANYGAVMGKVTDEKNEPIVGAEVEIKALEAGGHCTVKTDKHGEYLCTGLYPGRYEITVKSPKFSGKRQVQISGGIYGDPGANTFRNRYDFHFAAETRQSAEAAKKQQEEFETIKAGFDRALAFNRAGKYEEALVELQPVLEKDPSQWVVHAQLGVAYAGLNRLEEAAASYQKAIELNPTEPALYNNLGQVYVKMNRLEDARKQFETAAQLDPEGAATNYYNLGVTFYNKGDLKSAIEPLRKSTELDPSRADAFYWLGVCLYSTAETKIEGGEVKTILPPGTRESFERYLALDPNGKYASDAKAMLEAMGATVPTAVRVKKK